MPESASAHAETLRVGRYTLYDEIACGGMATVHYGQMVGAHGFSRVVAIKRMLPHLARDPQFHAMFVDEARLASRVQHPNVVSIIDVLDEAGEIMIVMDYVRGPSLSTLLGACVNDCRKVPVGIVANIGCAMLAGLHAAHEARDRSGRVLGIVHRDVSPQNVLVGIDGVTRIMDFGVAKATEQLGRVSEDEKIRGKISYMAPEQLKGGPLDRRTDLFATAIVLWSALAGRRLFRGGDVTEAIDEVLRCEVPPLGQFRDDVPPAFEAVLRQALTVDRAARPATAENFIAGIEAATALASTRAVADWVADLAGTIVTERDRLILQIERTNTIMVSSLPGALPSEDVAENARSDALTADWIRRPEPVEIAAPVRSERAIGRRAAIAIAAAVVVVSIALAVPFATRRSPPPESVDRRELPVITATSASSDATTGASSTPTASAIPSAIPSASVRNRTSVNPPKHTGPSPSAKPDTPPGPYIPSKP